MKKTVIRQHLFLLIGGRILSLILLFVLVFPWALYLYRHFVGTQVDKSEIILIGIVWICFLIPTYVYTYHTMLYRAWEKLFFYEDKIVWRCLFYPSVTLKYEDIKIKAIRVFDESQGERIKDYYKVGRSFILLANDHIPDKKLIKIHSKKGLIKYLYDDKLAKELRKRHIC